MSKTKAGGSTKNGRDSQSNRLGVKRTGGQLVATGQIVVRQRGTKYATGIGVALGKDHTLYATQAGTVEYKTTRKTRYTGRTQRKTVVSVV